MAWDITSVTKDVTVTHDGESAEVTVRKLSEGDFQQVATLAEAVGITAAMRRVFLERGIVRWTIPVPLTPEAIQSLPIGVSKVIFDAINEFSGEPSEDPPT